MEVCIRKEWRSVCDDGWNMNAAIVVCREHGMLTEGQKLYVIFHMSTAALIIL